MTPPKTTLLFASSLPSTYTFLNEETLFFFIFIFYDGGSSSSSTVQKKRKRKMEEYNKNIRSAGVQMLVSCLYYKNVWYKGITKVEKEDLDFYSNFGRLWSTIPRHCGFLGDFKTNKAQVISTARTIFNSFSTFCQHLVDHTNNFDEGQNQFYCFGHHNNKLDALPKVQEILRSLHFNQGSNGIFEDYLIQQFSMLKHLRPSRGLETIVNNQSGYSTPCTSRMSPYPSRMAPYPSRMSELENKVYAAIQIHCSKPELADLVFKEINKLDEAVVENVLTNHPLQRQQFYDIFIKGEATPTHASTSSKGKGESVKQSIQAGFFSIPDK